MKAADSPNTVDDVLCAVFDASRFNRELNRLVRLVTELRARLNDFADMEVVPPLLAGLAARGVPRHAAGEAVDRLLRASGGPHDAQKAAGALVYVLDLAAADLRGMSTPLPEFRPRTG